MKNMEHVAHEIEAEAEPWRQESWTVLADRYLAEHPKANYKPRKIAGEVLRQQRLRKRRRAAEAPPALTIAERFRAHICETAQQQVRRRGMTEPTGMEWEQASISARDTESGCYLLHWGAWYKYSARHGARYNAGSYLLGRDEGQWWIARVASTIRTVSEALEALVPAAVRRALDAGRDVRRQGDIWFVRSRSANYSAIEWGRHDVEETEEGVRVMHPEHAALELEGRWIAYRQRTDVGARAGAGD